MSTTTATTDKRTASALGQLDYSAKTARRASWEAYEFTITAPRTIRVINASYGPEKDQHAYEVTVEVVDGVVLPVECECPADQHHDQACKHQVAIAVKGGRILMDAALSVNPCLEGLPACTGPEGDELSCFTCYTAREKMTER